MCPVPPDRGTQRRYRSFELYWFEILAALANAVLLFGVAVHVLIEAVGHFGHPPDVPGVPMLVVATLGLAASVVGFVLLRSGSKETLNVELAATTGTLGRSPLTSTASGASCDAVGHRRLPRVTCTVSKQRLDKRRHPPAPRGRG
jgi:hypothetical protein